MPRLKNPIDVTVALPTWNSNRIIWLQLESLCRQKTKASWELFIDECGTNASYDVMQEYKERLREAGCETVHYNFNSTRAGA